MRDYILEIFLDRPPLPLAPLAGRGWHEVPGEGLSDSIQSRLFLTKSTGSTSTDTIISAYFDTPEDRDAAAELFGDLEVQKIERDRIDWLEVYQQSLEPIVIGDRFIVAPDASLLPETSDRFTIIVPQEQAFGTGSHETTSLCIEMLEFLGSSVAPFRGTEDPRNRETEGFRGLDIGSGSGILAIAMLRLGAKTVIAFDNDVDAYGALRDNRMRNHADYAIFIGSIEALRGGAFDVLTMNIIPEVILPLLPHVVSRMAGGAHLILSGILTTRRDGVVEAALANGLELIRERDKGEWWAGVFRR